MNILPQRPTRPASQAPSIHTQPLRPAAAPAVTGAVASRPLSATTLAMLEGPILPTLFRLAAPNVVAILVQTGVTIAETWFVGRLGTRSLAGLALVFPLVMLMQMMSAGAVGGAVSSSIARALGAGDVARAEALALHSLLIAVGMAALCSTLFLGAGPWLLSALVAEPSVVQEGVAYLRIFAAGLVAIWLANTLANVFRASGNMLAPAAALVGIAAVQIPLTGILVLGLGPIAGLGLAGAAVAQVAAFALGGLVLLVLLASGRAALRLRIRGQKLQISLFRAILGLGSIASLSALQTVITIVALTGLVAAYGSAALAGYGIGARLEFLQVPLVFGIGSALVAMVATNLGAGQAPRARRIAWTGALGAAGLTGIIGLLAAIFPAGWVGLFSTDPAVLATGSAYLRIVGPAYGFIGLGLALYFASQGAGQLLGPVLAGTARLVIAVIGGWAMVRLVGSGPLGLFAMIAASMVIFGLSAALAVYRISWGRR